MIKVKKKKRKGKLSSPLNYDPPWLYFSRLCELFERGGGKKKRNKERNLARWMTTIEFHFHVRTGRSFDRFLWRAGSINLGAGGQTIREQISKNLYRSMLLFYLPLAGIWRSTGGMYFSSLFSKAGARPVFFSPSLAYPFLAPSNRKHTEQRHWKDIYSWIRNYTVAAMLPFRTIGWKLPSRFSESYILGYGPSYFTIFFRPVLFLFYNSPRDANIKVIRIAKCGVCV